MTPEQIEKLKANLVRIKTFGTGKHLKPSEAKYLLKLIEDVEDVKDYLALTHEKDWQLIADIRAIIEPNNAAEEAKENNELLS